MWVDIREFDRQFRQLDPDHPNQRRLARLADICRGEFVEGFSLRECDDFDLWQFTTAERMRDRIAAVLRELLRLQTTGRLAPAAIDTVTRLLSIDPLDEQSYQQAMEIYAMRGRWSIALEHYDRCRTVLRSELGVDPAPETEALAQEIRDRAPRLLQRALSSSDHAHVDLRRPPLPVDRFFGRTSELQQIRELFAEGSRLVSIVGPPGVGKTRLAIESFAQIGDLFDEGVVYVDLTTTHEPTEVPRAVAAAIGMLDRAGQADELVDTIARQLSDRSLLLFIDNFEHVITATGSVARLLSFTRSLCCLITTREPLNVKGENLLRLLPFGSDHQSAVAMFRDRVRSRVPGASLCEADSAAIEALCAAIDWLPLAIELSVPLLRVYTVSELQPLLSSQLDHLDAGYRSLPERHQTLERAIDWSFRLLTQPEREFLSQLTVFRNGFTADAVRSVCVAENCEAAHMLASLIEKSLVFRAGDDGDLGFVQLESTREFCARRCELQQIRKRAIAGHTDYYREYAIAAGPHLFGPDQMEWMARLDRAHPNILAALDSDGDSGALLEAVDALTWYWYRRGFYRLGLERVDRALASAAATPSSARARALHDLGWFAFVGGDWRRAHFEYAQSLYMSRQVGDRHSESRVLADLGIVTRWLGDTETGSHYSRQAVKIARSLDSPQLILWALVRAYATTGGEFADCTPFRELDEAVSLAQRVREPWSLAHAHNGLGDLHLVVGGLEDARRHYTLALDGFERLGDRYLAGWTHEGLGQVEERTGDRSAAWLATYRALSLFDSLGDELNAGLMLARLVQLEVGTPQQRELLAGAADRLLESPGNADLVDTPQVQQAITLIETCSKQDAWYHGAGLSSAQAVSQARAIIAQHVSEMPM